jgi:peptide/histidine transporter 3/4
MSGKENLQTRNLLEGCENFRIWKKELFVLLASEPIVEQVNPLNWFTWIQFLLIIAPFTVNKYFVSIPDDYNRFGWVLLIKSKDQVFDAFLSWDNNIKNIYFNTSIKYLSIDNGIEFTNRKIIYFCK